MPTLQDQLRLGYWPSRQLAGDIPAPVQTVDQYTGDSVLNIACTQTGLPANQQRRIVNDWVRALPGVAATTVVFSTKVSQALFDAACAAPDLQALSVKWSACRSLAALSGAKSLKALSMGSSPGIADWQPLQGLARLEFLFVETVAGPLDLGFVRSLPQLKEFGLAAPRGRSLSVLSLQPLAALQQLQMLWLIGLRIERDGLGPLHALTKLQSLRTTFKPTSADVQALCAAVPSLRYFEPVG